jgi:hypothetical protein
MISDEIRGQCWPFVRSMQQSHLCTNYKTRGGLTCFGTTGWCRRGHRNSGDVQGGSRVMMCPELAGRLWAARCTRSPPWCQTAVRALPQRQPGQCLEPVR